MTVHLQVNKHISGFFKGGATCKKKRILENGKLFPKNFETLCRESGYKKPSSSKVTI